MEPGSLEQASPSSLRAGDYTFPGLTLKLHQHVARETKGKTTGDER